MLRDDLIETIKFILEKYCISGKYIEIEITETILVKDIKNILLKLGELINLSIQISLDDFTAGHSTARLLPILPIDIIKFDKSLLDSLEENE
ncbi:EAL domain-containing protein, partial [uncultured Cetobacterium sp.]|uniref:EAL domain-containing protein n=1 Tax=uncultured Cetobacterium sp. TaxID=527638 RepID=UPI00345D1B8E